MRKIKRKKNHNLYILVACVGILSVMGIGYSYLQETLSINMSLSKKKIDITDDVVTTGDGLYEDQYEAGRYIYRGSEPNNYIQFNNELWRIVAKEPDGTYKIIRDEVIPQNNNPTLIAYDKGGYRNPSDNTYCQNVSMGMLMMGCGAFAPVNGTFQTQSNSTGGTVTQASSIADYLNQDYYSQITETAKQQIQEHSFYIGAVSDEQEYSSIEKNIQGEKMHTWAGNIGLVNVSDVLKASTKSACQSAGDSSECSSYLTEIEIPLTSGVGGFWTINAYADASDSAWYVFPSSGYQNGKVYFTMAFRALYGVRPVVFLKSSTQFISGTGTKDNPYMIKE